MYQVDRDRFRAYERDIIDHPQNKAKYEQKMERILESSHTPDIKVVSDRCGDPTQAKAIHLSEGQYLELERRVKAVELAMYRMEIDSRLKALALKKFYWHQGGRGARKIYIEIPCDERTFYRWRRDLVCEVALILGWPIP